MTTTIANILKVLAASAVLATALASPSLAQTRHGGYGYQDAPPTSQYYWEHRQDWDR